MRTATVADLRNHFRRVSTAIENGESVEITRRGKIFATLVPCSKRKRKLVKPDIITAGVVALVPVEWDGVLQIAERLSGQYTGTAGHRGFDILHVATAPHLGAREFLTFDANQKKLAKAEGLKLPL